MIILKIKIMSIFVEERLSEQTLLSFMVTGERSGNDKLNNYDGSTNEA